MVVVELAGRDAVVDVVVVTVDDVVDVDPGTVVMPDPLVVGVLGSEEVVVVVVEEFGPSGEVQPDGGRPEPV